jgi:sugar phosphate isomerase/epimerase
VKFEFMASLGYRSMAPEVVCESLARVGYGAVGWTLSHFDVMAKPRSGLVGLVRLPERFGMRTGELVIQQDLVTADDALFDRRVAIVIKAIEIVSEVETRPPLNLFTGPARWDPAAPVIGKDMTYSAAWSRVLKGYEMFVERAEALGVDLAVEGVWGMICHNFFTTNYLVETFDSPRLGVNYDPSHDALVGIEDVDWVIRQWASKKRIKHAHLKDAVGTVEGERFMFPMLGEGRIDWTAFFAALQETGYDGYMSVEFESFRYYDTVLGGDPESAASLSMEQIRRLAAPSLRGQRGVGTGHAISRD